MFAKSSFRSRSNLLPDPNLITNLLIQLVYCYHIVYHTFVSYHYNNHRSPLPPPMGCTNSNNANLEEDPNQNNTGKQADAAKGTKPKSGKAKKPKSAKKPRSGGKKKGKKHKKKTPGRGKRKGGKKKSKKKKKPKSGGKKSGKQSDKKKSDKDPKSTKEKSSKQKKSDKVSYEVGGALQDKDFRGSFCHSPQDNVLQNSESCLLCIVF